MENLVMKSCTLLLGLMFYSWALHAQDYVPGRHDKEVIRLLQEMARDLPLQTTELETVALNCSVAKKVGLTWDQAVAEADARFGNLQPQRAAFLRKYLEVGSPIAHLDELQLKDSGLSTGTGGSTSRSLMMDERIKPEMKITVWMSQDFLVAPAMLGLEEVIVNETLYKGLQFDLQDRLLFVGRELPPMEDGTLLQLTQGTKGSDGKFYHVGTITGPGKESESIWLNADFTLRERQVKVEKKMHYRELYEEGILRKRQHYSTRQTSGGTETFVAREETFS
ncbi:hypothetical protein EI77_04509 [Prosthecobacter fusiformis]|uniref:Uncharacterized protein n=1 Tax=Prosthecobacter fusiformis TaxID=48464 RepID=A0A4R7RIC2_9BACT|nr:hypothetical protein [Prosthecobacter fusiformis]TDU63087.1 hypothetical protein EI77_04509 [Prosthecobacter fusiformis]